MEPTIRKDPSASTNSPARVLIVDDHPAVREGMVSRISRQTDLIVCGEAGDCRRGPAARGDHPARRRRDRHLAQGRQRNRPDQADQDARRLDSHAGVFDAPRFALRRASPPGRRARLHQQGKHHRPDSRRHPVGARRRNLPERRCNPAPGPQDGRAIPAIPGLSLESLSDRELEIFKLIGEGSANERIGRSTSSERSHDRYLPPADPAQTELRIRMIRGDRMGVEQISTSEADPWACSSTRSESGSQSDSKTSTHEPAGACPSSSRATVVAHAARSSPARLSIMCSKTWGKRPGIDCERQRPDLVAELHADYQARQSQRRPVLRYALRLV